MLHSNCKCNSGWLESDNLDEFGYPFYIPCPVCKGGRLADDYITKTKNLAKLPVRLDARFREFDWKAYGIDTLKQQKTVQDFLAHFEEWRKESLGLYIHSSTKGSGKSFLGCCLLNELSEKCGIRGRYVPCNNLISMQQADSKQATGVKGQIQQLSEVAVLLLDDIGEKSAGTNWLSDILFSIIDYRYAYQKITIFTSNCQIADLNLDDRCIDRIFSMSVQLALPELSIRTQKATKVKQDFLKRQGIF